MTACWSDGAPARQSDGPLQGGAYRARDPDIRFMTDWALAAGVLELFLPLQGKVAPAPGR